MKEALLVPPSVVQQVAAYFKLLSEAMRQPLLDLLRDVRGASRKEEKCVQELVQATQTSQANVAKYLKVMWQARILSRRSQRTSTYYQVED